MKQGAFIVLQSKDEEIPYCFSFGDYMEISETEKMIFVGGRDFMLDDWNGVYYNIRRGCYDNRTDLPLIGQLFPIANITPSRYEDRCKAFLFIIHGKF